MRRSIRGIAVALTILLAAAAVATTMALTDTEESENKPYIPTARTGVSAVYEPLKAEAKPATVTSLPEIDPIPDGAEEMSVPVSSDIAEAAPSDEPLDEDPYIEVAAVPDGVRTSLGIFTVTAYCDCPKCCGKWSGHKMSIPTQAGMRYPVEGYTISVDPKVIPLKSVVELEGYGMRYAHDTGSGIKGKRIDVYFSSHQAALNFGKQKLEVWMFE